MGRSEGKNKKLASTLLSGNSLKINSSRTDFEDLLSRLTRLQRQAVTSKKTSSSPEVINLVGKNMRGLDLAALNLTGSQFKNVDFDGAIFNDDQSTGVGPWDLSAVLNNSNFEQVNFNRANLGGVSLNQSKIKDSSFVSADLTGLKIGEADIDDTSFSKAYLDYIWFNKIDFREDISFKGAKIKNAYIGLTDLSNIDFDLVKIESLHLVDSDLNNTSFQGSEIKRLTVRADRDIDAVGVDFFNADIDSLQLDQGADLTSASFQSARVKNSNFQGAKLDLVNFQNAFFEDCVFDQAQFGDSLMTGVKFKNCSFKHVDLKNIDASTELIFENCVFS